MRTYTIYLDRIEISFDNCNQVTLEYKLNALSADLFNAYLCSGLGKGKTYRRLSLIIDYLSNIVVHNVDVNEASAIGVLRHSLLFLRRFNFPDFQIHILNHV